MLHVTNVTGRTLASPYISAQCFITSLTLTHGYFLRKPFLNTDSRKCNIVTWTLLAVFVWAGSELHTARQWVTSLLSVQKWRHPLLNTAVGLRQTKPLQNNLILTVVLWTVCRLCDKLQCNGTVCAVVLKGNYRCYCTRLYGVMEWFVLLCWKGITGVTVPDCTV